jgi:cytidylate kinase
MKRLRDQAGSGTSAIVGARLNRGEASGVLPDRDRDQAVGPVGGDRIRQAEGNLHNEDRAMAAHLVIAIDGPAAAGKSTVASRLARQLDALCFDTGAIYRALALVALECKIDINDAAELSAVARSLPLRLTPPSRADGRQAVVWLGDRDVTCSIRTPEVDRVVSAVSAHPAVRAALLDVQRKIGESGRVVMVGREIGTVVMPNADLKIWLEASVDERARRRMGDLERAGKPHEFAQVRDDLIARDRFDAERAAAPMTQASDAVVVETDGLNVDQVVDRIVEILAESQRGRND